MIAKEQKIHTPRLRRVLDIAADFADEWRADYIGTEHVLLALSMDQGVASRVLENLGITPEQIRAEMVTLVGLPPEVCAECGRVK